MILLFFKSKKNTIKCVCGNILVPREIIDPMYIKGVHNIEQKTFLPAVE